MAPNSAACSRPRSAFFGGWEISGGAVWAQSPARPSATRRERAHAVTPRLLDMSTLEPLQRDPSERTALAGPTAPARAAAASKSPRSSTIRASVAASSPRPSLLNPHDSHTRSSEPLPATPIYAKTPFPGPDSTPRVLPNFRCFQEFTLLRSSLVAWLSGLSSFGSPACFSQDLTRLSNSSESPIWVG